MDRRDPDVDDPPDRQRLVVEVQDARVEPGPAYLGEGVGRGAQRTGHRGGPTGDDADAAAGDLDVDRVATAVHHRHRSVGRGQQQHPHSRRCADGDHRTDAIGAGYGLGM